MSTAEPDGDGPDETRGERTVHDKTAVVTGASAGIGEATARALAREGFRVRVGARRVDRLERLAREIGGEAAPLDVTDPESVEAFASRLPERVHLLVNNAGAALGLDSLDEAVEERWIRMYQLNVLGVLRMTRALLPRLEASGNGHVINLGSTASFEAYPGGGGYCASKHAERALTRTLRAEVLGRPIRVTEICPGLVETEFSRVRFDGDRERAEAVYRGMEPLTGEDVAECIAFAATRPPHVNLDEIVLRPRDQLSSTTVYRRS
jgi:NADP-dependent 3-hydroxy acid dehydrogenase YdfG